MKKLMALFLALSMMLTLCACGGEKSDKKKDDYLGLYEGVSIVLMGEAVDMSEVYDGVNTIEIKSGGKCEITLEGDTADATYKVDGNEMTITIDGEDIKATLKKGVIVMDFFGSEMTFAKAGYQTSAGNSGNSASAGDAVFPEVFAADMSGDWHGWCVIEDAGGAYEDDIEEEFEILARFAFDEEGHCKPYLALSVEDDMNFRDLEVSYNEDGDMMQMEGTVLGLEILQPAYKEIALSPSLLGLQSAHVELPTPYGLVVCDLEEGQEPRISCPEEITLHLR